MLTKIEAQRLRKLASHIHQIKDAREIEGFLNSILTETELREISNRLEIVKLLKQGVPHHEIAERLNVGVATVTRGSKEIQKGSFKNVT